MPKEKLCLSEVTSTKHAKDKSNSSTLLAMRDAKDSDHSSGRGSCSSSDKDSGFSENGSEWQQTESEERRGLKSQSSGNVQTKQSQKDGRDSGKTSVAAAGPHIQPLYIINNIVVNQGDIVEQSGVDQVLPVIVAPDSTNMLHGGKNNPVHGSHVILLQQPILMPASFQNHKPSTRKTNPTGRKITGTYLPMLNSYPSIAPHPCKKPSDKAVSEAQNLIKRICTEPMVDLTAGPKNQQNIQMQPPEKVSSSCPAITSSSSGLPNNSASRKNTSGGSRHRRFLNTFGSLRQSGLLDISVQTKELLRESMATDRDIAQLRRHTELLCQAACNNRAGPEDKTAWESLRKMMEESGSYPNLNTQPRNDDISELKAAKYRDTVILDPNLSCDLSQPSQVNRVQERELQATSPKVTVMSPDSSTT